MSEELLRKIAMLERRLAEAEAKDLSLPLSLSTCLTSGDYDGDLFSSGNHTVDLVTDFGLPANVLAVDVRLQVLSPTSAAYVTLSRASGVVASVTVRVADTTNYWPMSGRVRVASDGTINMYCSAGCTIDLEIHGYVR